MNMGVPIYPLGKEPLPPGLTEDDRPALMQQRKVENWMRMASESCAFKTVLSGGVGAHRIDSSAFYACILTLRM